MKYLATMFIVGFFVIGSPEPMPTKLVDMDFGFEVLDEVAAYDAGQLAFFIPGVNFGSCASCHKPEIGGYSFDKFPLGNRGHFDTILKRLDPNSTHKIDQQDERTPPTLNSMFAVNGLNDGALGAGGLNENIHPNLLNEFKAANEMGVDGILTQAEVGLTAHNLEDIVEKMRSSSFCNDVFNKAFGVNYVTKDAVKKALAVYQKSQLPTYSRFQKWLRGESKLKHAEAYPTFLKECASCHGESGEGHKGRGFSFADNPGVGIFRVTKDSSDLHFYKAPQLYNLSDAPGLTHRSQDMTVYKAIRAHTKLSRKEARQQTRFIRDNFQDPNLDRYLINPYKE